MTIAVVTGASGYVGRALVGRLVAEQVTVRAVSRRPLPAITGASTAAVDVRSADALAPVFDGADVVFHLVAHAHDTRTSDDTPAQQAITLGTTLSALAAAERARVPSFVFVSSLAVFGPTGSTMVDETHPCHPVTPYGKAKLAAEEAVGEYARRTNACASCIRPAMIYGPGAPGNFPRMIAAVRRGTFPAIPEFGNLRSAVGIDDVVAALLLAWRAQVRAGRPFIITDGAPRSTRQMYDAIRRALGRGRPRMTIPAAVFYGAARAGDAAEKLLRRRVPFDSRALSRLTDSAVFSPARAMRELGFHPTTTLDDSLPGIVHDALRR